MNQPSVVPTADEATLRQIRTKIQTNYLDLTPDEARTAWHNKLLNDTNIKDYMDFQENPVSYFFRDMAQGALKGSRDAVQEIAESGESLVRWISDSNEFNLPDLPQVDAPMTTPGQITSGVSQFATGFVPYAGVVGKIGKISKIAALAKQAPKTAAFIESTIAGMLTDATAFDPKQAGLANLVEEHPSLRNPLSAWLSTDPDAPESEGRLKHALEGALLGVPIEGVFQALRYVKGKYWQHNLHKPEEVAKAVEVDIPPAKTMAMEMETEKPIATTSVEVPDAAPIPGERAPLGEAPLAAANPADFDGKKLFEAAVETVQKGDEYVYQVKPEFNYAHMETSAEDVIKVMDKISEATAQTAARVKGGVEARNVTAAKAEAEFNKLGGLTGAGIDELRKTARFMTEGPGLAAKVEMHRKQLVTYGEQVAEICRKASEGGSTVDVLRAQEHMKQYAEVLNLFAGIKTQTGRTLGAFNNNVAGGRFAFEKYGPDILHDIENTSGAKLRDTIKKFGEITDANAKAQFARQVGRAKFLDGLLELRQSALLSNPGSMVVNAVGNTLALTVDKVSKYLAIAGKGIVGLDPKAFGEIGADMYGSIYGMWSALRLPFRTISKTKQTFADVMREGQGFKQASSAARDSFLQNDEVGTVWKALFSGESQLDPLMKLEGRQYGGAIPNWAMGPIIRFPFKLLTSMDEAFKGVSYHSELRSLAYREGLAAGKSGKDLAEYVAKAVAEPADKLHMAALGRAREVTFNAPLGKVAGDFGRLINNPHPAVMGARIVFLPFYKVAVNLGKFAIDRSPLAVISRRFNDDIAAGGMRRAEALSRVAVGSSLMGVGWMLYSNNMLTGSASKEEREDWKNSGIPEYGVKIGGKWYRYNRTDPLAMWLGVAADACKWVEKYNLPDSKADELGVAALAIISDNLLSKSYMKSLSEAMDILFHADRMDAGKWSRNLAATFVPFATGIDAFVKESDPYTRQHETLLEAVFKARFSPEDLVPRRHAVYGTPVNRTERIAMAYDMYEPTDDPVLQELTRVNANVGPMPKYFEFKGQRVELNLRQMDALQGKLSQLPLKETLQRVISSPSYQKIKDSATQKDILKRVISKFRTTAKRMYLSENKETLDEVITKLQAKVAAAQGLASAPSKAERLGHWFEYYRED